MRVAFVGDIHGEPWVLLQVPKDVDKIIQVGDFGFLHNKERWPKPHRFYGRYVDFIDGNHDSIDFLRFHSDNYEHKFVFNDYLTYIPRGHIERIGDTVVGFMGGGESIDRAMRTPFVSWFPDETIAAWQTRKMVHKANEEWDGHVDLLVSHSPPLFATSSVYSYTYPEFSVSCREVQYLVDELKPQRVICGHAHRSLDKQFGDTRVTVLDINEIIVEEL